MSNTLLSYAVATNPDPIQISPQQGNPSLLTLMIVVSNNTHQIIQCAGIAFSFPRGVNANALCSNIQGIEATAPNGWNIQQNGFLFMASPNTPPSGNIAGNGLVFVLSNIQVNQQPGVCYLMITENTGQQGVLNIPLAKFPPQS